MHIVLTILICIIKLTEKPTVFLHADFYERLLYLCFHYRTISQEQKRIQNENTSQGQKNTLSVIYIYYIYIYIYIYIYNIYNIYIIYIYTYITEKFISMKMWTKAFVLLEAVFLVCIFTHYWQKWLVVYPMKYRFVCNSSTWILFLC